MVLSMTPPQPKPEPVRRPAKVARQLALAHHLQAAIERGFVADQAALARKLGLTRARVTQLFDLLHAGRRPPGAGVGPRSRRRCRADGRNGRSGRWRTRARGLSNGRRGMIGLSRSAVQAPR